MSKTTILTVENNPQVQEFYAEALASMDMRLFRHTKDSDVLETARRLAVQGFIISIDCPFNENLITLEEITKHPEFKDYPTVLVTAQSQWNQRKDILSGYEAFILHKPFSLESFRKTILKAFGRL